MTVDVCVVAALDRNCVIGLSGRIAWHLPNDLRLFRELTMNSVVIMGRITWESLPSHKLPGRHCIVLTRDASYDLSPNVPSVDAQVATSPSAAYAAALHVCALTNRPRIVIAGGECVYGAFQGRATSMVLTHVDTALNTEGMDDDDVAHFPKGNLDGWTVTDRTNHPQDTAHAYAFTVTTYVRSL